MPNQRSERPETLIDSILPLHPRLGQDLFQMDAEMWAIHGYIPVDGEVILAEFDHRERQRPFSPSLRQRRNIHDLAIKALADIYEGARTKENTTKKREHRRT